MKSLDQIDTHVAQAGEKRIPISSLPFTISASGSYYLSGNLTGVSGQDGITIKAGYVTIDLNGFALLGVSGSISGITATPESRVRIFNGSVKGWGKNGIDCSVSSHGIFDHLRVSENSDTGLYAGAASTLSNITAESDGSIGISTNIRCTVTQCEASGCGLAGLSVNDGGIVTNCTAAFSLYGFSVGNDITLIGCTAVKNTGDGINAHENATISKCTANGNGSGPNAGISTGIRANISGCTAIGNNGDGIVFSGDSFVLNNHASTNSGAGFHDLGGASRIDGNVSRENIGTGVLASTGDTVVRNNSGANGNGAANNQYGPTTGPNWGPVGTAASATSPWANF
jgi:hypothetical protein